MLWLGWKRKQSHLCFQTDPPPVPNTLCCTSSTVDRRYMKLSCEKKSTHNVAQSSAYFLFQLLVLYCIKSVLFSHQIITCCSFLYRSSTVPLPSTLLPPFLACRIAFFSLARARKIELLLFRTIVCSKPKFCFQSIIDTFFVGFFFLLCLYTTYIITLCVCVGVCVRITSCQRHSAHT